MEFEPKLSPKEAEEMLEKGGFSKNTWENIPQQSGYGSHTARALHEIATGDEVKDFAVVYERERRKDYGL